MYDKAEGASRKRIRCQEGRWAVAEDRIFDMSLCSMVVLNKFVCLTSAFQSSHTGLQQAQSLETSSAGRFWHEAASSLVLRPVGGTEMTLPVGRAETIISL